MSETWHHYKRRALAFIDKSIAAQEANDSNAAEAYLLVAAENLFRAAKCAPASVVPRVLSEADEILALLERSGDALATVAGTKDEGCPWQVISDVSVRLDEVAGLTEAKRLVYNLVVRPIVDPTGAKRWKKKIGGGLLLYGPPGTGKTLFAKAIAGELDALFINVVGSSLMSKWVGEAEKNVDLLFHEAARHERCVLFIDEVEALLPVRGQGSTVMDRVVPAFLAAMDGIGGRQEGLLLLGATNRPEALDPASLRRNRFEHQVYIGLPDLFARQTILIKCFEGIPLKPEVDLSAMSVQLEGYSGADIAGLCDVAVDSAWDREEQTGYPVLLDTNDIIRAHEQVKPSVSKDELKRYEDFFTRM